MCSQLQHNIDGGGSTTASIHGTSQSVVHAQIMILPLVSSRYRINISFTVKRCPQQAAQTENFRVFRLASLRYNWLCVFLENDNIYEVETSFCLSKATKQTRIALKIMFLSLILYTKTSSATNPVYLLLSNSCMALSE